MRVFDVQLTKKTEDTDGRKVHRFVASAKQNGVRDKVKAMGKLYATQKDSSYLSYPAHLTGGVLAVQVLISTPTIYTWSLGTGTCAFFYFR